MTIETELQETAQVLVVTQFNSCRVKVSVHLLFAPTPESSYLILCLSM